MDMDIRMNGPTKSGGTPAFYGGSVHCTEYYPCTHIIDGVVARK